MKNYKNVLITGSAGFIGYHLSKKLLMDGYNVIGIDNLNDYYNPKLKERRNNNLINFNKNINKNNIDDNNINDNNISNIDNDNKKDNNTESNKNYYKFIKLDFSNWDMLYNSLKDYNIDIIIHLGAQAGVRYSLENPWAYINSNEMGTLNIFELCRKLDINKVVFASSSSVYGGNKKVPFSEDDRVDNPVSLYAATKKSNELMAHTYNHLYGIKMIGLRFFTVYGEYGRPDMAFWKFAKNILLEKPIDVYNYGKMVRDFTYVSDVVDGIIKSMNYNCEYEIFNLGNDNPTELEYAISLMEEYLGKKAIKNYMPMQLGDVEKTWADLSKSRKLLGYNPQVKIEDGLKIFCNWFLNNWEWVKEI